MIKRFIQRLTNIAGYEIKRTSIPADRAKKIFLKYQDFTMISEWAFIGNLKLVDEFSSVEGSVVECGVWRGGMSAGMAEILPGREFFLFDSFEGLPEAKKIDGEGAIAWQKDTTGPKYHSNCKAEIEFAEKAMAMAGVKPSIVKGWFNETLPLSTFKQKIAILRLDADWYDSTMDCLIHLFPHVATGGLIIFDDYYTWDGCSRAVHDYLSRNSSVSRIHKTVEGVAFIIKTD